MKHRGPDASLCYQESAGSKLGHNRLKILDLDKRSNQPFNSADGKYSIIYNGEIYNYRDLAKKYGLKLRTTCDTEVLIELYIKIGPKMLEEVNGMFAFVILDKESQEFFVARDRLGIKPLYYTKNNGRYIFSSEIAPILNLLDRTEIDEFGLRQYKKLRTFFNGRTLYKDISMFPAGSYMLKNKIHKFWNLPEGEDNPPKDEEVRGLIEDAVRLRKISDVEIGSYLSGGLDSTIIAGLAEKPHTWTVGFRDFNEFEWSEMAAEKFNSKHHEVVFEYDEFLDMTKYLVQKRKEPLSVPNEVLLYKMTKAVKKYNTVILSGEGADELFFGYDRIFRWADQAKEFNLREFDEHYSYGSHEDDEVIEDALSPFMNRKTPLDITAAFFQISHLHGLLRRLDNSTMECSVEARVPFVDHRLITRMAGVSAGYRMQGGVVKAPLKRIFSDLVPPEIINRKKIGFPVNLEKVFAGYAKDGEKPMDSWLRYNLEQLGLNED